MDKKHREAITRNLVLLGEDLNVDNDFLNVLQAKKIIGVPFREKLEKMTRSDKASEICRYIQTRGPKAMNIFIKALIHTSQDHLAEKLDPGLAAKWTRRRETGEDSSSGDDASAAQESLNKLVIGDGGCASKANKGERENNERPATGAPMEEDDEGIVLCDGPVDIKVVSSTRPFYEEHKQNAFPMDKAVRGTVLIINVQHKGKTSERFGTDIDRDNLENLWKEMNFKVKIYNDTDGLTAAEIDNKLKAFSEDDCHREAQCCIVYILSHGGRDDKNQPYVVGTDGGKVYLDFINKYFNNTQKYFQKEMPRLFFIQACRGRKCDGVDLDKFQPADDIADTTMVPIISNTLIGFPTQEGFFAWRNSKRGSWYIEAMVRVFMTYSATEDISCLLRRVNKVICDRTGTSNQKACAEYVDRLENYANFFFFPGIKEEDMES